MLAFVYPPRKFLHRLSNGVEIGTLKLRRLYWIRLFDFQRLLFYITPAFDTARQRGIHRQVSRSLVCLFKHIPAATHTRKEFNYRSPLCSFSHLPKMKSLKLSIHAVLKKVGLCLSWGIYDSGLKRFLVWGTWRRCVWGLGTGSFFPVLCDMQFLLICEWK